jgi:hypothetical protein
MADAVGRKKKREKKTKEKNQVFWPVLNKRAFSTD